MQWTIPELNVSDEQLIEKLNGLLTALRYEQELIDTLLLLIAAVAFCPSHNGSFDLGEKLCAVMYKETSHHWQEMMAYISRLDTTLAQPYGPVGATAHQSLIH